MKNRSPLLLVLAAGAILGAPSTPAQDQGPAQGLVISIDFDGGSLADLIAEIRAAGPNINILIPPDAAEVRVPSLSLKEVTVATALRAISDVASNQTVNVATSVQQSGPGQPVFAMRVDLDRSSPRPTSQYVAVYSIKALTEAMPGDPETVRINLSAETILTAIDTGLDVGETGGEPEIRYHEESGLVFVRANTLQHGLIRDVIQNMDRDQQRRRQALQRADATGRGRGGRSGR